MALVAAIDVATGAVTERLPERKLSELPGARDGSFVTFMEDVTEKTDYDVIGGTENTLKLRWTRGDAASRRRCSRAKDLKGLTLRWSDDGRTFAYAKKGEVFVQRRRRRRSRAA